jgi:thiamine pyrophosphokinase
VLIRYLDVVVLALAAAPVLALEAPFLGYAVGAGAWVAQRVLAQLDRGWIRKAHEPRTQLGLNLFEAFGRIWLLAGAIVAAGVIGGRADGLTAALTIFGAYSVAFAVKVIAGPPERRAAR